MFTTLEMTKLWTFEK